MVTLWQTYVRIVRLLLVYIIYAVHSVRSKPFNVIINHNPTDVHEMVIKTCNIFERLFENMSRGKIFFGEKFSVASGNFHRRNSIKKLRRSCGTE